MLSASRRNVCNGTTVTRTSLEILPCHRGRPNTTSSCAQLLSDKPGHVIVAGDMDADPASDSMRFWTGRHVIQTTSVCYRSAIEAIYGPATIDTYTPGNPFQVDEDWPYSNIDHVLVRCSDSGPTLLTRSCRRAFDTGRTTASDHYGLVVDYDIAKDSSGLAH